jgi:hypothetical protein
MAKCYFSDVFEDGGTLLRLRGRDLAVLPVQVLATVARLAGPGGVRAVVAESVPVKQQLLILDRSGKRAPRLRLGERVVAGAEIDRPW